MSRWSARSVAQYDLNGKYLKTWSSGKEAATALEIYYGNISRSATGKRFAAGGFFWKYVNKEDFVEQVKICQCCGRKVDGDLMVAISAQCLQRYKQSI